MLKKLTLTSIKRLFFIGLMPIVMLISPLSHAMKGVELGFAKSYYHVGVLSLYTLDGKDFIVNHTEKGFVSTKINFKREKDKNTSIFDIAGEIGRFIDSDQRFSFSLGTHALIGKIETKSNGSTKKLNVRGLVMGFRLNMTSWLSEAYKLNGSVAYFRSPKVLSFGDFEYLQVIHAEVGMPIIASSEAYISYEKISGKTSKLSPNKTLTLLNSFALGIRVAF